MGDLAPTLMTDLEIESEFVCMEDSKTDCLFCKTYLRSVQETASLQPMANRVGKFRRLAAGSSNPSAKVAT